MVRNTVDDVGPVVKEAWPFCLSDQVLVVEVVAALPPALVVELATTELDIVVMLPVQGLQF